MTTKLSAGEWFTAWCDDGYPRPMLCRPAWLDLGGEWQFAPDPEEIGTQRGWHRDDHPFAHTIQVPFPPGSELSGVAAEHAVDVVWYRRTVTAEELAHLADGDVLLLHFEAVDYRADVWVDGQHAATHEGGFTPFTVQLERGTEPVTVVVRAEDRREDLSQPRGKQDWRETAHGIWYERSNGIWRDVWMEAVPRAHVSELRWDSDLDAATVRCELTFSGWLAPGATASVDLALDGAPLTRAEVAVSGPTAEVTLHLPELRNRMEWSGLVWSPETPTLLDATVRLRTQAATDEVVSYVGLRKVEVEGQYLRVNDRPTYVRAVLDQGYWAQSYLTPPSPDALRVDLQLSKDLGFNTVRIHQRVPDRRFLTWADRLGLEELSRGPLPDAVACMNDLLAFGTLRACAELGIDVPGRLLVTGWDDIALSRFSVPSITTVSPDKSAIAQQAVDGLLGLIDGDDVNLADVVVPHSLVVRESTDR